jgi:hypothetical protein
MRGLLSALWSFLQHPAATFEDHLTALEDRLRVLEARLGGDLETAVDTGVAGIQARLETVKSRLVEDLKHELRRVALLLALVIGCGMLAIVAVTFALMAAWTDLQGFVGAVGASVVLAIAFLLAGLVTFALLRSVLRRS